MKIIRKEKKDLITVMLEGRIETATAKYFEQEMKQIIKCNKSIVLDFNKIDYVSSAGLRTILSVQKECDEKNVTVEIVNANKVVRDIFELTGFNKIVKVNQ